MVNEWPLQITINNATCLIKGFDSAYLLFNADWFIPNSAHLSEETHSSTLPRSLPIKSCFHTIWIHQYIKFFHKTLILCHNGLYLIPQKVLNYPELSLSFAFIHCKHCVCFPCSTKTVLKSETFIRKSAYCSFIALLWSVDVPELIPPDDSQTLSFNLIIIHLPHRRSALLIAVCCVWQD